MTKYIFLIVFDILLGLSAISIRNNCSLVNPCMNLAKCSDQNGIECLCSRGFSGSLCEIWPRECLSDFCLNHGTCVMARQIPRCICKPEFSGKFCEFSPFTAPEETNTNTLATTSTTESVTEPIELNKTIVTSTIESEKLIIQTEAPYRQNSSVDDQDLVKSGVDSLKSSICDYHPCLNNAECIDLNDTEFKFYCVCPENYSGLLCEKVVKTTTVKEVKLSETSESSFLAVPENEYSDEWKSTKSNIFIITEKNNLNNTRKSFCAQMRPCDNNAQCVDLEPTLEDPRTFICLCSNEYTGAFCHVKKTKSVCSINPCFNSGICVPSSDNISYTCDCLSGFSGDYCELKLI
ncbi:neurogenic locus Notch -like [Brachionus plicatilis]|uniref:Neurogenic locus Notch-like n=1 Tax=Brachionus plicatilis TaxID=10195 RepID=A0A3M7RXU1_BRAPC|nr:neurogenic locus Notch -like [Brachionus plicatilis]